MSPGGGVEVGEGLAEAASRELYEESGITAQPAELGPKLRTIEFRQEWPSGDFETGTAHFFKFQIDTEIVINRSFWTPEEHRDILEVRWWNPSDLIASGERVGPPGLAALMVELG